MVYLVSIYHRGASQRKGRWNISSRLKMELCTCLGLKSYSQSYNGKLKKKKPKATNYNINIRFERKQMKGWSVHRWHKNCLTIPQFWTNVWSLNSRKTNKKTHHQTAVIQDWGKAVLKKLSWCLRQSGSYSWLSGATKQH